MHAFGQVRLRGFDGQVKVIVHDHEGMDPPVVQGRGREQALLEGSGGPGRAKYRVPVIAAIDDVVDRVGEVETQRSGHTSQNAFQRPDLSPNLRKTALLTINGLRPWIGPPSFNNKRPDALDRALTPWIGPLTARSPDPAAMRFR